jgi:plastocyanin
MVAHQIKYPPRRPETDPQTHKPLTLMPANLVKGSDAADVAAYVAFAAGRPGKDTGALAAVGVKKAKGTAQEKNGTLDIPVAQSGLAYTFATAQAKAGRVTIESKNPQPTGHDIAIQGNGVNAKGPVVQGGGTSKFTATLKPGTYTFYCSVPGHREGGMVGKLTVK